MVKKFFSLEDAAKILGVPFNPESLQSADKKIPYLLVTETKNFLLIIKEIIAQIALL